MLLSGLYVIIIARKEQIDNRNLFVISPNLFVKGENMYKSERIKSEEPVVLTCREETDLQPGAQYGPIVRNVYIIETCIRGSGAVVINGKEFPVKAGDCYVLLPGDTIIHKADSVFPRQGIWCAIGGVSVGRYLKKAGITSESPFASPEAFNEIYRCMEQMLAIWDAPRAGRNLRLKGCVYEFLSILFSDKSIEESGDEWIDNAIGILETRYNEITTVNELADATGLERAYFSTLFKSKLGISPHEYITTFKLNKARALLEDERMSVGDIADIVGIPQKSFWRVFKKEFGVTPLAYRKSIQNKLQS